MHTTNPAGGNFWRGARQGLITSGLNHVAHRIGGALSKEKSLSEYMDKMNETIDNRISDIEENIAKNQAIIDDPDSRAGKVTRKTKLNKNLKTQKSRLKSAKKFVNNVVDGNHGFTISTKTGGLPKNTAGTVYWGDNNKSLLVRFNGGIRVLIHETIHVYDIINGVTTVSPFKSGQRILIGVKSEVRAWQTTSSLRNSDAVGASSVRDIDANWVLNHPSGAYD